MYLRKLSRLRGKFCRTTALVIDTFYVKYCSVLMQYHKIDLLIDKSKDKVKVKEKIFLDPFLSNFMRPKTSDKLSVNINHV